MYLKAEKGIPFVHSLRDPRIGRYREYPFVSHCVVLCCWGKHFTFPVSLSTQACKWVLANYNILEGVGSLSVCVCGWGAGGGNWTDSTDISPLQRFGHLL